MTRDVRHLVHPILPTAAEIAAAASIVLTVVGLLVVAWTLTDWWPWS
ncbi:hypothetical protein [Tessaracoccus palaemonis]|uniref:Uncharacterized protein n=1 Tax=Tessaracoccus palaemonis TaxID=2829499 RepID=A0ABX8SH56_9ACTN|nr:hypothetical protein [Tessaracoccus palaemonis]QXT62727.1 hypothetical protein KDB89_13490 [Tessaracoccus palaemonis]